MPIRPSSIPSLIFPRWLYSVKSKTRSRETSTPATPEPWRKSPRTTLNLQASRTRPHSDPRPNSSSSTISASTRRTIRVTITSIQTKAAGIPAATNSRTWATSRVTKRGTSRCRLPTAFRISGVRWFCICSTAESKSKPTIMRWRPAARVKSTSGSRRCCHAPTS